MSHHVYVIRNYQPADFKKYALLRIEAEKLEPTERFSSWQLIQENLDRPNYSPEQNLLIAETAGNVVGYMDITPELGIGRVILSCFIQPDHRRIGLATRLLAGAISRAEELGIRVLHVNIAQDNMVAKNVLSSLGFEFVRLFLELKLNITRARLPDAHRAALDYRHLQPGDEDKLTRIQNRSFTGTWGYNPNTTKEIAYRTNSSGCSTEDIILAYNRDRVVGYCWTMIEGGGVAASDGHGRISMLGVEPNYRGRGVGRQVLLAGLSYLKSKGVQVAELTVDSANETACALYRSIGFEAQTSSLWYEKVLD